MKKVAFLIACPLLIISLAGCASINTIIKPRPSPATAAVVFLPPYSGPKARIIVADFEAEAAKAGGEISSGLREMLVSALINSNRFSIIERQASNSEVKEGLIISASITEFEPESSGGRSGIGGGGSAASGAFGGLLGGGVNKAHMALDVRITDASASKLIAATRLQGQATDISGGVMKGGSDTWALGEGLAAYAGTPLEKAIRLCLIEAVRYIGQAIPANYYKY